MFNNQFLLIYSIIELNNLSIIYKIDTLLYLLQLLLLNYYYYLLLLNNEIIVYQ